MSEYVEQIREHILIAESYAFDPAPVVEVEDAVVPEDTETPVIEELRDIAFKLRAHMETEGGDYALGVEMGMQRAADMIDNLIRRHTEGLLIG